MPQPASLATELFVPTLRALSRCGDEVQRRAQETGLAILAEHGIAIDSFADVAERVPFAVAIELLENAVEVSGDDAFALRSARVLQHGELGMFQFLAGSAATLRDSIQLAIEYMPLLNDGVRLELAEAGDVAHWRQHPAQGVESPQVASEYLMAAFLAGAGHMLGTDAPPHEIWMMHPRPRHAAAYEEVLGAPVRFGRECNAIVLPRIALDVSLATADPHLLRVLRPHAAAQLVAIHSTQPFLQRVRALMLEHLAEGATLVQLAQMLHMSESSVQRRLRALGTSHKEVLDDLRRGQALSLMTDLELNLNEIAFKLGFRHRSALHRAFMRWYGCSPSEHRERALQSEFYRFYRG